MSAPSSARDALVKGLLRGTVATLVIGAGAWALPRPVSSLDLSPEEPATTVLAQHHCWTHEPPAQWVGRFPGGTVVSRNGGAAVFTTSPKVVGEALDVALKGRHTGLTVYGFCPGTTR